MTLAFSAYICYNGNIILPIFEVFMNIIRIGIIGVGNMGFSHVRSLLAGACPRMQLTCVADNNPDRLAWVQTQLPPNVTCFPDASSLLEAHLCDAVLIAAPHYFHPPLVMQALDAGYHVMSEKPAGVNISVVREMNRTAEKAGKVFGIMFNQRTNPRYRAIRKLMQSGRLGELRRSVWIITDWYRPQAYYNSGSWRATWAGEGGGILLNQCPHQLDLWQWICGMPACVDAEMGFGKWHDIEVEDEVCARVTYPNGASGLFLASTGDPCGVNRLEITLSRGKILCENGNLVVYEFAQDESEFSQSNTMPYSTPQMQEIHVPLIGENSQHVGILNNFADAILDGSPLLAPGTEGIRALSISNAMHLSAWKKQPIAIPADPNGSVSEWEAEFDSILREKASHSRLKVTAPVYTDSGDLSKRYHL